MDYTEPEWILPLSGLNIGSSFFIPTLRPSEMIYNIDCAAKEEGIRIKAYVVHEKFLGVRIWRVR
jgi:hypothetical protein